MTRSRARRKSPVWMVPWLMAAFLVAIPVACRMERSSAQPTRVLLDGRIGLVRIPGGAFRMGSREDPGAPPVEATVAPFWMAQYETTVAEFARYLAENPAPDKLPHPQLVERNGHPVPAAGWERRPIATVTFDQAAAYARWLSDRTGRRVRLPTEAEWERAARGGIRKAPYPWGWGAPEDRAVFARDQSRPVGSFRPNPFGLFDMAGNVFEWCAADPSDADATERVARGGSWSERDPRMLRVFRRAKFPAAYRDADVGFRVVCEDRPAGGVD
jgi:formylglycine-generating enzyme required for sulfatase activity